MFAKERQEKICQMLCENGAVTTAHLVQVFDVSVETIRRDLLSIEQQGRLTRVHGGAVASGGMKPYYALPRRNQEFSKEKRELAQVAMAFIREGDYIGLDTGSTANVFAEVLKEQFENLTIVTHSMDLFEILTDQFPVILSGGRYLKEEKAFYGALALESFDHLRVQKAFIFPSAVSLRFGICDYQQDLFPMQKKLIEIADQVFVLADSSKFESRALLKIDDMRPEHYYVTDSLLTDELKNLYVENGMQIFTKTNREA